MTIKKSHLEMFPLPLLAALVLGALAREAYQLGGKRLPVGVKWNPRDLTAYINLPDLPAVGGPDYIKLVPSDFDGLSVTKTRLQLEALLIAPYGEIRNNQVARLVALNDECEARRMRDRCKRIKGLLRRAGVSLTPTARRKRVQQHQEGCRKSNTSSDRDAEQS